MTTRSTAKTPRGAADGVQLPPLPDPPRKNDMQQAENFERPGVMNTVARFFGALREDSNVLVSGSGYVCASRSQLPNAPYPDLVIAFGVDRAALINNNGYEIDRVGKPPDFVLEVASEHTGRRDYTTKRDDYARLGIPEYWRFDHTGGRFHDAALAGDRLINGAYERIAITEDAEGRFWGYSPTLELYLCWDQRRLRFYDPKTEAFLQDPMELEEDRDAARSALRAAEAQREPRAMSGIGRAMSVTQPRASLTGSGLSVWLPRRVSGSWRRSFSGRRVREVGRES